MKRAIRYLRFSNLGQSNGSIERQELYTDQYIEYNKILLVDTFIDRGHSAKTFDRPDFNKLTEFIKKHQKDVDYLIVDQLDRFSRDAGEAMTLVKNLQRKYNIQIVSVTEGIIFDYDTPGSYFRTGLQLLLAEEDNINRSIKIRGGNYTARAKEGRFLSNLPPFGYKKVGEGKERTLEIVEEQAKVVLFIFRNYLRNVPLNIIKEQVFEMGFNRKGNMAIERVLSNPAYAGLVKVKPFKEYPGGIFPARHEPIIDKLTWDTVQKKMEKPDRSKKTLDDEIPLRGVLKCHCGQPLSGAPSRNRKNHWYYYYKCKFSKHLNLSAVKAHDQLLQIFELMSLPMNDIRFIKESAEASLNDKFRENQEVAKQKKGDLERVQEKLYALEEKWISNEIGRDTYERWSSTYNGEIFTLRAIIERLSINMSEGFKLFQDHIHKLNDMKGIYELSDTIKKRAMVSTVFDSNLYYQNGIYRTPSMLPGLDHNYLIMKQKGLLEIEKKRDNLTIIPSGGAGGICITLISA
ncbi:recombinase family protein [Mucilaginibacter aquariorum]|uniref:Recombinase family protein n=1 Tax=Mucilaginibacter aquariorum TaxID=2967225 RepID=A0ABT1T4E2_9SPHI|nr:recombinase family protein [Mucilaginibacter aquariorum]MCQ6959285.1 recombinase family protein [Mucilaginibacter aquariorum]